jgi:hypothetical protein
MFVSIRSCISFTKMLVKRFFSFHYYSVKCKLCLQLIFEIFSKWDGMGWDGVEFFQAEKDDASFVVGRQGAIK